ncbi:oxidoreductase [Actinocrispum sp. NPDC049592]|uniref:oxidoreductase n=1 Tax=Actinocrispum sp. NPDC049592 TaxID=3154835 RepID=UPI003412B97E
MGSKWTAADIPDQTGRTAVVTGANSGLGLVTAQELARAGAHVVVACRDLTKGSAAVSTIRSAVPDASLSLERLDLADLLSVREFAEVMAKEHDGLDLLINNAGIMAVPKGTTADGFESQFGTNHLGHFALTGRLAEMLSARPGSRVVTVSSGMHRIGRIRFDDLQSTRRYQNWLAYGQSKLANLLFAFELDRRAPFGSYASHPGYANTNLQNAVTQATGSKLVERAVSLFTRTFAQSMEMGALPSLYAATYPGLPGGSFIGPDNFFEQRGHPTIVRARKPAYNEADARRLWEVSEELTNVTFPFTGAENK